MNKRKKTNNKIIISNLQIDCLEETIIQILMIYK